MTTCDKIIIPMWMYEDMVRKYGRAAADLKLKEWNALAVENWEDAYGDA